MDAAGKDGAIKHVMSGVNPRGCEVYSFKQPSAEELKHDFLWRTIHRLPERGRIGIFNRSSYQEVLIVRVHPAILHGQGLPDELLDQQTIWRERYRSIVDLERQRDDNGRKRSNIRWDESFHFNCGWAGNQSGATRAPFAEPRPRCADRTRLRRDVRER